MHLDNQSSYNNKLGTHLISSTKTTTYKNLVQLVKKN